MDRSRSPAKFGTSLCNTSTVQTTTGHTYFVYLLRSINYPDQVYVGCTHELEKRLNDHKYGKANHTKKFMPWKLVVYTVFDDKEKAFAFEKYLKSHSGRVFRDRRFL